MNLDRIIEAIIDGALKFYDNGKEFYKMISYEDFIIKGGMLYILDMEDVMHTYSSGREFLSLRKRNLKDIEKFLESIDFEFDFKIAGIRKNKNKKVKKQAAKAENLKKLKVVYRKQRNK